MFVYLFLFFTVLSLSLFLGKPKNSSSQYNFCLLFFLLLSSTIAGLRSIGVGTDTEIYVESYYAATSKLTFIQLFDGSVDLEDYHDKGYLLLSWFSQFLPGEESALLFSSSFLFLCTTMIALIKLREIQSVHLFFYFIILFLMFYHQSYNYMRQFCAIGILFLGYSYFLRKKYLICFLFLFVAANFHSSSLVILLVPLIYYFSYNKKTSVKILFLVFVLFLSFIIVRNFNTILIYLVSHGFVIDIYGDRYGETGDYSGETITKIYIYMFAVGYGLIVFAKLLKQIKSEDFIYLFSLHSICLSLYCLTIYSVFLFRLSLYFSFIENWYMALLLSNKKMPIWVKGGYCVVLLYFWLRYFIIGNACETFPYKSQIIGI